MTMRWFLSGKVRHAVDVVKHARKMVSAQRDIISPEAVSNVNASIADLEKAIDENADAKTLQMRIDELEKTAGKYLKAHPNPEWRENIEVLLVAIAVAMAIRTFFLQPFKIPTGSMQPTLYGVTVDNYRTKPDVVFPNGWKKFVDGMVHGVFYHELKAPYDCELLRAQHKQVARFINKHEIFVRRPVNGSWETNAIPMWMSPDERLFGGQNNWSGLAPGQTFREGEHIIKLKEVAGDHLFVDRVTYNFRQPQRGEIIVFKTKGITAPSMQQDQFYIKRLVALGDERVQIGKDRHLVIDGVRLDASTERFENVYDPIRMEQQAERSEYSGHVNASHIGMPMWPYNLFPNSTAEQVVPKNHYMVMGDNTLDSFDSRAWGAFPRENVIGKAFFVYWPISNRGGSRFGMGYR